MLYTGIRWEFLPRELGYGAGMTGWRRSRDWNEAAVWPQLHELLPAKLQIAGALDWSRAAVDSSSIKAVEGVPQPGRARSTTPERAPSTT